MNQRLNIALVTAADPKDRRSWSGSIFFMGQALQRHVGAVDYLGPMLIPFQRLKTKWAHWTHRLLGRRYYPTRTPGAAAFYARKIQQQLAKNHHDLIIAPAASVEIACLQTALPIVYISDVTFTLMQDLYPIFSQLRPKAAAAEAFFEKAATAKAGLLLYASEWAARSAEQDYGVAAGKIRVIPFGANIDRTPARDSVVGKTPGAPVQILFLAKEWERKGGPIAFDTLLALLEMGIDTRLTVCGVVPPSSFLHPNMKVIAYLDKNVARDRARFEQTLQQAHLLLLPTRAECYGMVFCEANAYGLPVFAPSVGGIGTIVKAGRNGYLLPPDADGRAYARAIAQNALDPARYAILNQGARQRYEQVLNWDVWGRQVRQTIQEVLEL